MSNLPPLWTITVPAHDGHPRIVRVYRSLPKALLQLQRWQHPDMVKVYPDPVLTEYRPWAAVKP